MGLTTTSTGRRQTQTIPNQERLLAAARANGVEVVHTIIQSLTEDGRDRSLDHKLTPIHVAPSLARRPAGPIARAGRRRDHAAQDLVRRLQFDQYRLSPEESRHPLPDRGRHHDRSVRRHGGARRAPTAAISSPACPMPAPPPPRSGTTARSRPSAAIAGSPTRKRCRALRALGGVRDMTAEPLVAIVTTDLAAITRGRSVAARRLDEIADDRRRLAAGQPLADAVQHHRPIPIPGARAATCACCRICKARFRTSATGSADALRHGPGRPRRARRHAVDRLHAHAC